ncbi:MAG TPA: hypothetical protein PKG60_11815 [Spirochaetota bacterium]|nr:hypothetical protein [Spirochaetota bacterium]HPS85632.1 hypothetical protein [Spirochaetota bacterium]
MPDLIKTVTDNSQFQFLLDNFFKDAAVFIKTNSGSITLQYIGYSEGNVAFRIPLIKSSPESVVVYTRHKTNTIYLSMKFIEKSEDTFVFIPVKFQIISESRKEDRKLVGIEGGKSIMYLNNLITDYIIERGLSTADKKIDKIKEFAEFELKKKFELVKIVFINESKTDNRLKHILSTSKPIYMPNLNVDPEPAKEEDHNFYINHIYKADISLSTRHKYVSEITVPIMYNNVIIYGYLQVNSSQPVTDGMYAVVRRMSIAINQLMVKHQIFSPMEERFLLADISHNGMSFVFKEKKFLRYFEEGSKINFDILFPTQKKALVGAIVRNITFLENRIIKTGCEIFLMDDTSKSNYDEFIQLSQ